MTGPPERGNGPPEGGGAQTPPDADHTITSTTSSHHTAGTAHPSGYCRLLRLRRAASQRLPGGDPWPYEPHPQLSDFRQPPGERGYLEAAAYLADHGLIAAPNREALRQMWRKGGHHRQVAEAIAKRWEMVA
jgi:hypothetical protein